MLALLRHGVVLLKSDLAEGCKSLENFGVWKF
jgi:hypothetical protein